MKTNLTNWLCGLCAILMIVVLVFQFKQQAQLDGWQRQQESLASAMSQQQQQGRDLAAGLANQVTTLSLSLESQLTQSKQQAEAFLTKLQEQGSTNSAEMRRGIFQVSYDLRNELTKMRTEQIAVSQTNQGLVELQSRTFQTATTAMADQVSAWKTGVREMRQQLDDLVNSGALFPNKSKPSGEAVALAKAAEQAGDTNLAKIYYLSAVNHAPSEFSILNGYAGLVLRSPSSTLEDFARLKSVLQISLYQISPGNITNALALLSQVVNREEQSLAAQTPTPVPVNWQERFKQLLTTNDLDTSWRDLKQLSRRWDSLNEITESLREEQPASDLLKQVENALDLTQRVLAAARLTTTMDTVTEALDSSSEQPEKAVSLLQTAEATLGQLWGINSNIAGWPDALSDKINAYPTNIQSHVEAVARVKSRPFLATVESERDSAKSYVSVEHWKSVVAEGHPYQRAITKCDGCYERAAAAGQNISSLAGREKAEAAIKVIRGIALDAKRKQFDEYQKWVLGRCQSAFDSWKDTKVFTQNDALNFFRNANLSAVDQSALSPEVSRAFNDVLGKLTAKMDGNAIFSVQKNCAEQTKKKLEDF